RMRLRRSADEPSATHGTASVLPCRFEELERIAVWILELDLSAPGADFHLVPEMQSGLLQRVDTGGEIRDPKDDPIPTTRFLMTAVGQRARTRGPGPAEQNL